MSKMRIIDPIHYDPPLTEGADEPVEMGEYLRRLQAAISYLAKKDGVVSEEAVRLILAGSRTDA